MEWETIEYLKSVCVTIVVVQTLVVVGFVVLMLVQHRKDKRGR